MSGYCWKQFHGNGLKFIEGGAVLPHSHTRGSVFRHYFSELSPLPKLAA